MDNLLDNMRKKTNELASLVEQVKHKAKGAGSIDVDELFHEHDGTKLIRLLNCVVTPAVTTITFTTNIGSPQTVSGDTYRCAWDEFHAVVESYRFPQAPAAAMPAPGPTPPSPAQS